MAQNINTEYDDVLSVLISFDKGNGSDAIIEEAISKAFALLSDNNKKRVEQLWESLNQDNHLKWKYVLFTVFLIEAIQKAINKDEIFSVKQIKTIKTSMELLVLLGIKENRSLWDKAVNFDQKKFDRLVYTITFFISCSDDFLFRTWMLPFLEPILASLIFIAHAVVTPPNTSADSISSGMSSEMYGKLENTQTDFKRKLVQTMEKCHSVLVMKALMVIHGTPSYLPFMRENAIKYLYQNIVKPNGVLSFISVLCNEEEITNLSKHWHKLEIAAKLLIEYNGNDVDEYYNSFCHQLIEMLKQPQTTTIAKYCIKTLYERKADICEDKIFKVIAAPFFPKNPETPSNKILWTEQQVTQSIEILSASFINDDSEFKQLPTKMLIPISRPIFLLYVKSLNSISSLRHKLRKLAIKILSFEETQQELFTMILDNDTANSSKFGINLHYQLGDSGDFEIVEEGDQFDQAELEEALFKLVHEDKNLSVSLFNFLLKSLPSFKTQRSSSNVLQPDLERIHLMEKQLILIGLLIKLSNLTIVLKGTLENPECLLSFVKSLVEEGKSSPPSEEGSEKMDFVYTGLMLVKVILNEGAGFISNWRPFEEFVAFLNSKKIGSSMSENSKTLADDVAAIVRKKKGSQKQSYDDLDVNKKSKFESAIDDLADALLPVRAHGLISLTKLIEDGDRETLEKVDILVCLFQENLKHEDSFIYLTAINGLCALTLRNPQKVIHVLIEEFINMPERVQKYELSAENRVKLGEILVKAVRSLGEMAVAHKVPLLNGFLCAVRDSDPLVRASSLSCLGEICKILGFRLGGTLEEIIYCIGCIIKHDKDPTCRRAAVLVITLLLRGLSKDILTSISDHLTNLYRSLKYLRDNDNDDVIRLHAQLALEEIDHIVKNHLFVKPKLEKTIFLLPS